MKGRLRRSARTGDSVAVSHCGRVHGEAGLSRRLRADHHRQRPRLFVRARTAIRTALMLRRVILAAG